MKLPNGLYRTRPRLLSETGSYALAFAVASTGGWNTTVKSMKRCSCIEVIPTSAGSMSPRTVLTLPFMRIELLVLDSDLPRECILCVGSSQYEWDGSARML